MKSEKFKMDGRFARLCMPGRVRGEAVPARDWSRREVSLVTGMLLKAHFLVRLFGSVVKIWSHQEVRWCAVRRVIGAKGVRKGNALPVRA